MDFLVKYLIDERDEIIDVPDDYNSKKMLLRSLMNVRLPSKLSDEFLEVQDEFLTSETLNKTLTSVDEIAEVKDRIMLWQGDITTLKVDAIVNAANSKLLGCFIPHHNCIDNVIHSAAGLQLREECSKIMEVQDSDEEVGRAKITGAYNLPSKHVIHTVGPAIPQGMEPCDEDKRNLANCYKSCLDIASYNKLQSIAFCCISTGVFNFPQVLAAKIAVSTVEEYLDNNETSLNHVVFNVFTDTDYLIYKKLLFGDD
ncbi:protein-ADP-ribose hydrolase [Methanobrevibacter sp.]|uniref:protein-ADP-ribose hydrolase n=1 Tax=Methanobrevibacter sp. TaxID=66852 RepID=UPI002E766006|nr:protein-ADP-ribose hydrolase [Methanobrevibacter sp.]MEE0940188.1 protein-ADP-ribose hydrolase [Methanobrevibacter sp.]